MNENIQNIIKNLNTLEFVKELSNLVATEVGGTISLCFPTSVNEKNKIHFLVDSNKEINGIEFSMLMTKIKEKLNYDYEDEDDYIVIADKKLFKQGKIEELFNDITTLSEENFVNVTKFLSTHYSKLLKTESKLPDSSKKEAAITESKKDESNIGEKSVNDVFEYLKSNKEVLNSLINNPDLLDKVKEKFANCKKEEFNSYSYRLF